MNDSHILGIDQQQRRVVDTESQPWQDSPAAGVQRKPLEREAAESGRVTSIVRFAPNSAFAPHRHPQGEEILVLDGVFSDEHDDFPAGTYFRNPPGSAHTPASAPGCQILVKLNWFADSDSSFVKVDTHQAEHWQTIASGVQQCALHQHAEVETFLIKLSAGSHWQGASTGCEWYVVSGALREADTRHRAGTWVLSPEPQAEIVAECDSTLWVKVGHI